MNIKLKPIVASIALMLTSGQINAAGGDVGENGSSSVDGLIGYKSIAKAGTDGDGDSADSIINNNISNLVVESKSITGKSGDSGGNSYSGGGGVGGNGGAIPIGAISIGGAGGYSSSSSANGGQGGGINGININVSDSNITGAEGGQGGSVLSSTTSNASGGAGSGGHGGGSIFGAVSTGGAGGYSQSDTRTFAIGGDGGVISEIEINIMGTTLTGATGGQGGSASGFGGAGAGGHGGGSVFGGVSIGGSGGDATSLTTSSAYGSGGSGGDIDQISISISAKSNFTGAIGGGGGSTRPGNGAAGIGGHGGASIFGAISAGGAGGEPSANSSSSASLLDSTSLSNGGLGGSVRKVKIALDDVILNASGLQGGLGGAAFQGGSGAAGHGGGSVFGAISTGGAGGLTSSASVLTATSSSNGGVGGGISDVQINLDRVTLNAVDADGGNGGDSYEGAAGEGGYGGGSVFGAISNGGVGGRTSSSSTQLTSFSFADGGNGGDIENIYITISESNLIGSQGGKGGSSFRGGSGAGGHGGGSIFGAISTGGAGGHSSFSNGTTSVNGGSGGNISSVKIILDGVTFDGSDAEGGNGGSASNQGAAGAGGYGGGSVFGGFSYGGAGGSTTLGDRVSLASANGGDGGEVTGNWIILTNVTLDGTNASAGQGGVSANSGEGVNGRPGGSIFGGISQGGAGGFVQGTAPQISSNGGNGGAVSGNFIELSGITSITGDIYGGFSQGGAKGNTGIYGEGGFTNGNEISLIGDNITIGGYIYGGLSINGDGTENEDASFDSYYQGNTLNIRSGRVAVKGIKNVQQYNWLLPRGEFADDIIVESQETVNLDNTLHRVDVELGDNNLQAGDIIVLIDNARGKTGEYYSRTAVEEGFFIVYDAVMEDTDQDQLILRVLGSRKLNPEAEALLKGRVAQLAFVDQGADMIYDGIGSARASLRHQNANLFVLAGGGTNRYKMGGDNHVKLNDMSFAIGGAQAFKFGQQSVGMVGAFVEAGKANYDSYTDLGDYGQVNGGGHTHYSGIGGLFHIDVGGTDISKVQNKPNIFDSKYGLYVRGAVRLGNTKVDFHSADLVNGYGQEARYNSKSRYFTAALGAGYVLTLNEKSAVDFYGRYTFSRVNGKDIQVVNEVMNTQNSTSNRLRLGARYGYMYSEKVKPYAGLAFERNFTGDVEGTAYGFTIKEKSLSGNSGIVEAGLQIQPKGATDPLSLHLGLQGHFGQRKGATASLMARYVF